MECVAERTCLFEAREVL